VSYQRAFVYVTVNDYITGLNIYVHRRPWFEPNHFLISYVSYYLASISIADCNQSLSSYLWSGLFYQKLFHSIRNIKVPFSPDKSNNLTISWLICQSNIIASRLLLLSYRIELSNRLAYQFFVSLRIEIFQMFSLYRTRKTILLINLLNLQFYTFFFFNPASPLFAFTSITRNEFFARNMGSWVDQLSYRTNRILMSVTPEDVVTPDTAMRCRRRQRWSGATACYRDPRLNWAVCIIEECADRRE